MPPLQQKQFVEVVQEVHYVSAQGRHATLVVCVHPLIVAVELKYVPAPQEVGLATQVVPVAETENPATQHKQTKVPEVI